jgi:hypothetical protein
MPRASAPRELSLPGRGVNRYENFWILWRYHREMRGYILSTVVEKIFAKGIMGGAFGNLTEKTKKVHKIQAIF